MNRISIGVCAGLVLFSPIAPATSIESVVALARQYVRTSDERGRSLLASRLADFDGDFDAVISPLKQAEIPAISSGYYPEEKFRTPELKARHPDDLLYFVVPRSYHASQRSGLLVFMHGGGKGSARTAPDRYLRPEGPGFQMGKLFLTGDMVVVGPSAPWNENSHQRWCLQEADDYIADVIIECKARFNIDPDRVFLMGHSMGGFGAYHQVQRQPDRFAAVVASAGAWRHAYWPVIGGTPLWMIHGVRDAEPGVRGRDTDIGYARWARDLCLAAGIEHTYLEHPDGHSITKAAAQVREFIQAAAQLRRDPYRRHVVLASPIGYRNEPAYYFPVRHNRWLTLDETKSGTIDYSTLAPVSDRDNPASWRLEHAARASEGAVIDAVNRGANVVDVTVQNVSRFTLWLHPRMVDLGVPVVVNVNGRRVFDGRVQPSLATLLDSYLRRLDWGMVYPAKIVVEVQ